MASNAFGTYLRYTTWGESHGPSIGVVIDGFPANVTLSLDTIQHALHLRAPGQTPWTTPRKEPDTVSIQSGVFNNKTTGAPITLIIENKHADSRPYEAIQNLYRPGHANYPYHQKYHHLDYRAGARASARETAARVAAGAVAQAFLDTENITVGAYLHQVGPSIHPQALTTLTPEQLQQIEASPIFAANEHSTQNFIDTLTTCMTNMDSVGGAVGFVTSALPVGLGDPIYNKIEALLAQGMMSIPATKGFEMGLGFQSAEQHGSTYTEDFLPGDSHLQTAYNHAGGTLGGLTSGEPIWGKVAFKPTSSTRLPKQTVHMLTQKPCPFQLPKTGKHDPCVAIRGVPVVKAMLQWVLADALLKQRCAQR